MKTTVNELPESRVRVEVEVPPEDVNRALQNAARGLAREMRMPGFRKGKAPPNLVLQRLGRPAVMEEAVRESLPEWYERALLASGISPVGDPEVGVDSVPEGDGEPVAMHFEIAVRPEAKLGKYLELEVPKADADVPGEVIDDEIERLRQSFAKLETVDRAAAEGDTILIDFVGRIDGEEFEGGTVENHLLELGAGTLIDDFDEQLHGASAGDSVEVSVTFPEEYRATHLAGKDAVFSVKVKEVREKMLPEVDDEFAADASEFDTLEELREDMRQKLAEGAEERIEEQYRVAVVDAVVEGATVTIPDAIIESRATERWQRLERQIRSSGMDPAAFLQMQGKTREQLIEEAKPDALAELRRDAVLAAVAEAEQIEPDEEDLLDALSHTAEDHEKTTPEKLLTRLRREGRDQLVREDVRIRKALDRLVESAKPISMAQAEAREKLWTPG
ncbi:MAG TPA: trigger factor [Solirubrobacterales bacterium]|nr:trigger factor [Solirubrobacterales bacterium]